MFPSAQRARGGGRVSEPRVPALSFVSPVLSGRFPPPQPAYQNLRQRVDNFVSNHLATHTWSPHLNKNQLRNNIRQQVLK